MRNKNIRTATLRILVPWIFRYFGFLITQCFTGSFWLFYPFVTYSWRQCTYSTLSPGTVPSHHSLQHFPTSVVFFHSNTWTSHWLKVITELENRWSVGEWTFATHWALTPAYLLHLFTAAQRLLKILPKLFRTCYWAECKCCLWKRCHFYLFTQAAHSVGFGWQLAPHA